MLPSARSLFASYRLDHTRICVSPRNRRETREIRGSITPPIADVFRPWSISSRRYPSYFWSLCFWSLLSDRYFSGRYFSARYFYDREFSRRFFFWPLCFLTVCVVQTLYKLYIYTTDSSKYVTQHFLVCLPHGAAAAKLFLGSKKRSL